MVVVMTTPLQGLNHALMPDDVVQCSDDDASRLIAAGVAREPNAGELSKAKIDAAKPLHPGDETREPEKPKRKASN
jgi:hypothetical protein